MNQQADRVRQHTGQDVVNEIDRDGLHCVRALSGADSGTISKHIDELDREWDVERVLQTNASILALGGVMLGAAVDRKFLILPGAVLAFFFQHALHGWCPPIPLFRRMGFRTRREINREKYALKAVRGDFDALSPE